MPDGLNWNVTGWLMYNKAKPKPAAALIGEYDPVDDMTAFAYDNQTILAEPNRTVTLDVQMNNLGDGAN
jgi:iron transport multicopper oxidase